MLVWECKRRQEGKTGSFQRILPHLCRQPASELLLFDNGLSYFEWFLHRKAVTLMLSLVAGRGCLLHSGAPVSGVPNSCPKLVKLFVPVFPSLGRMTAATLWRRLPSATPFCWPYTRLAVSSRHWNILACWICRSIMAAFFPIRPCCCIIEWWPFPWTSCHPGICPFKTVSLVWQEPPEQGCLIQIKDVFWAVLRQFGFEDVFKLFNPLVRSIIISGSSLATNSFVENAVAFFSNDTTTPRCTSNHWCQGLQTIPQLWLSEQARWLGFVVTYT